jgi:hypothetical protein
MIPAAIEIVGGVRIAEQAGEPQAQIPGIDRYDDVAFVVDDVLERRQRIATLTSTGSSMRPCSLPRLQRLKGMRR